MKNELEPVEIVSLFKLSSGMVMVVYLPNTGNILLDKAEMIPNSMANDGQ